RLAAVACRPAPAIDFAQDVFWQWTVAFDLDVLEQTIGKAEFLGHEIHDLIIVFGLETRRHDLFAPLQRAVGCDTRTGGFKLSAYWQQVGAILAASMERQRRPCGRMWISDDQELEFFHSRERSWNAGNAVAGVALHKHG